MGLTVNEITQYAANGIELSGYATQADYLLWYRLRDIYTAFRTNKLTKEDGEKRKKQALRLYHADTAELLSAKKVLLRHADMWSNIERAAVRYSQDRTLDNADLFVGAVYNCKLKEQT